MSEKTEDRIYKLHMLAQQEFGFRSLTITHEPGFVECVLKRDDGPDCAFRRMLSRAELLYGGAVPFNHACEEVLARVALEVYPHLRDEIR